METLNVGKLKLEAFALLLDPPLFSADKADFFAVNVLAHLPAGDQAKGPHLGVSFLPLLAVEVCKFMSETCFAFFTDPLPSTHLRSETFRAAKEFHDHARHGIFQLARWKRMRLTPLTMRAGLPPGSACVVGILFAATA